MITVPSSIFCSPSLESDICPETQKGFTTLCIVTFLHSRSLQSTLDENRISWQTESLFHWRRYRFGSLKEITMYSSSDGTFLSETKGCRCCGEAFKKTRQTAVRMCHSFMETNEMTFKWITLFFNFVLGSHKFKQQI